MVFYGDITHITEMQFITCVDNKKLLFVYAFKLYYIC